MSKIILSNNSDNLVSDDKVSRLMRSVAAYEALATDLEIGMLYSDSPTVNVSKLSGTMKPSRKPISSLKECAKPLKYFYSVNPFISYFSLDTYNTHKNLFNDYKSNLRILYLYHTFTFTSRLFPELLGSCSNPFLICPSDNFGAVLFEPKLRLSSGVRNLGNWESNILINGKMYEGEYVNMLFPLIKAVHLLDYQSKYSEIEGRLKAVNDLNNLDKLRKIPNGYNTTSSRSCEKLEVSMHLSDIQKYQKDREHFCNTSASAFSYLVKLKSIDKDFDLFKDLFYYSLYKLHNFKTCKASYREAGVKLCDIRFKPVVYPSVDFLYGFDDYFRMDLISASGSVSVNRSTLLDMYLNNIIVFD